MIVTFRENFILKLYRLPWADELSQEASKLSERHITKTAPYFLYYDPRFEICDHISDFKNSFHLEEKVCWSSF